MISDFLSNAVLVVRSGIYEGREMSGEGIISVRLPRSLLGAYRASAKRQAISIHEAARRVLSFVLSFGPDNIKSLPEPPRELDTPRISLYVGWNAIDQLEAATAGGFLTNSRIFRRLLYGLLITKEIEFVQKNEHWKLQIASRKSIENSISRGAQGQP
jgi:hypothetical protein